jgi:hypothetical protein
VCPLFINELTPASQQYDTTPCGGCKQDKEF